MGEEPTSLEQTVLMLRAEESDSVERIQNPTNPTNAPNSVNPRKRPSPDDVDPLSSNYVQPAKRPRMAYGVPWSRHDVTDVLYERNAEAVAAMLVNSNNEFGTNPIELVLNVVISTVPDNVSGDHDDDGVDGVLSPLNEMALCHFGCDATSQCAKRVSLHDGKRLNFCVLSDSKIRAFGATDPGAIR